MNEHDPDRTFIERDNGFSIINTSLFEPGTKHYVLPIHCEKVFYPHVPNKASWLHVVRHDPRGRPVKRS